MLLIKMPPYLTIFKEAKANVDRDVRLPQNSKMVWAGEFESKERASSQLAVIVPAVLLLILFLLYFSFGEVRDTLIAASTIPFAFIGGFISLWVTLTVLPRVFYWAYKKER